jgi:hypothetical protein
MSEKKIEQPVPCVVLAGGRAKPELQAATGQVNRALVVVKGKTLLAHGVDALRDSEAVGPVTVVGDVPESADYARLPDGGGFVENLFAGIDAHADAPYVLIATSDLPFLTGQIVTDFVRGAVRKAEESGAGFVWPIVPVEACYRRFPGVKRTSLRLREGAYTGGNLALTRPAFALKQQQSIADAYAARKSPARLATMLGAGTLLRLALSQLIAPGLLTIPYLEARVSALLGGPARALLSDAPELATDLDRLSDFEALRLDITNRRDLMPPLEATAKEGLARSETKENRPNDG